MCPTPLTWATCLNFTEHTCPFLRTRPGASRRAVLSPPAAGPASCAEDLGQSLAVEGRPGCHPRRGTPWGFLVAAPGGHQEVPLLPMGTWASREERGKGLAALSPSLAVRPGATPAREGHYLRAFCCPKSPGKSHPLGSWREALS